MKTSGKLLKYIAAERADILARLEKNRDYQQLLMLDEIASRFKLPASGKPDGRTTRTRKNSKKSQLNELVRQVINDNNGAAKMETIASFVKKHGVTVSAGTLKNYLYQFKDLKSDRKKGWLLR